MIQVGPAGNLVNLPNPSLKYEVPRTRQRTAWIALSGAVHVQQVGTTTRQWVFKWAYPLQSAQYGTLVDIYEESLGSFPYELHDPSFFDVPNVVPVDTLGGTVHLKGTFLNVSLTLQEVI